MMRYYYDDDRGEDFTPPPRAVCRYCGEGLNDEAFDDAHEFDEGDSWACWNCWVKKGLGSTCCSLCGEAYAEGAVNCSECERPRSLDGFTSRTHAEPGISPIGCACAVAISLAMWAVILLLKAWFGG